LSVYRLPLPYERSPAGRRLSGFGLALAINLALLFVLMTLGIIPPPGPKNSRGLVVDLIPASRNTSTTRAERSEIQRVRLEQKPTPKPPRILLPPVKPTITPPPAPRNQPWIEMSKDEMAAADISKLPTAASGSAGDSEAVGRGPNGETLYAAEWAREPTDAELRGYLPHNPQDGYGVVACKTIPGNRVDDCVELAQSLGSHLASAVRQAAWQFRVRPPRKNGKPMIGEWVSIRIDYSFSGGSGR